MRFIDCNFLRNNKIDQTCKPSSVENSYLSWQLVAKLLDATSIGHAGQAYSPSTVLLRIGFTWPQALTCAGELLPRLSTLAEKFGGISLLHYPWGHPRRPLAVIPPCGARTFLAYNLSVLYPQLFSLLNIILF